MVSWCGSADTLVSKAKIHRLALEFGPQLAEVLGQRPQHMKDVNMLKIC